MDNMSTRYEEDGRCDPLCRYCGSVAQGNFSIHRDGFGEGPEVGLCDDCGKGTTPTCAEIWARIAQAPGWTLELLAPVLADSVALGSDLHGNRTCSCYSVGVGPCPRCIVTYNAATSVLVRLAALGVK